MRRKRAVGLGSLLVGLYPVAALAGSGWVALQTGAPSCGNGTANVYVDCGNGTVTDNRTGLVWLKNANCFGLEDWYSAEELVAGLSDVDDALCQAAGQTAAQCDCGLSDGSSPGEWRLPTPGEWHAMVANALGNNPGDPTCSGGGPTITNDTGDACWPTMPSSFTGVVNVLYWTSVTSGTDHTRAWIVNLFSGSLGTDLKSSSLSNYAWPVRGGQ